MKTTADFLDRLSEPHRLRVLELLDRAFRDDLYSANTRNAFLRGYQSQSPNVVLLHTDHELAGIAVVGTRDIGLAGARIDALTVGPLAIDPRFQNRGFSTLLMGGIDELAAGLGAPVAYLVGIAGFYHRFGYYPLLSRTKVTLNTDAIQLCHEVEVHPYSEQFLPEMMSLFRTNAQMYSCASRRTEHDWEWLTRHACDTYYFFRPQVVTADHEVVGYFCTDSRTPGRIREAVHGIGGEAITSFLSGLKEFFSPQDPSTLEIMTPANSPLHEYLRGHLEATFTEIIQSDGGQLLKVCNVEQLRGRVQEALEAERHHDSGWDPRGFMPVGNTDVRDGNSHFPAEEQLPGILSGYLRREGIDTQVRPRVVIADAGPSQTSMQTPFIYQGDNY